MNGLIKYPSSPYKLKDYNVEEEDFALNDTIGELHNSLMTYTLKVVACGSCRCKVNEMIG